MPAMSRTFVFLVVVIVVAALCPTPLTVRSAEAGNKRIAVLDFEDAAANRGISAEDNPMALLAAMSGRMGGQAQSGIGQTVSSILTTELVKEGTYKVVERNQLQSLLKEQNLATSGVVNQADAARIGKVLGVSALVTGSVTECHVSSRTRGIMGIGKKTTVGKVAVNARMVDTTTGEILFAVDGSGEEAASGLDVGGYYSSDTANYGDSLLGKATKKALENVLAQVVAYSPKLAEARISGFVAYYDNGAKCCYLDLGKDSGIEKDQTLYVTRVVREIKSPATGEVIKRVTEGVAEIKVTEIDKSSSTALCVAGKCEEIREKDVVSNLKN